MPLKHHAKRVANQDNINAGLTDDLSKGGIVGCQNGESFALLLVIAQSIDGNSHRILALWVDGPDRAGCMPASRPLG